MAKSRLITTSFIGGVEWLNKCPESWKEKAYKDLNDTLSRVYNEPTKVGKRGIEFEKNVYSVLGRLVSKDQIEMVKCSENFKKVLRHCFSGKFQKKIKKYIQIGKHKYCLYGKKDVTFPNKIVDIKTTSNLKPDKYTEKSFQAMVYCYMQEVTNFEFLIAVFPDDYTQYRIESVEVFPVDYFSVGFQLIEKAIIERIQKVEEMIKKWPELEELWLNTYSQY